MPTLIANRRLPWNRYWVPWDGTVHSGWDGSGFVTNPSGVWGRSFNPQLRTTSEVLENSFVVLVGLPGMGKTQVVEQLKADWQVDHPGEQLVFINGRLLDSIVMVFQLTVGSPRWKPTLESGGRIRLLIDAVDETVMRRVDLISGLLHAFDRQPMDRIRVVLVTRPAEWTGGDEKRFAELWTATDRPTSSSTDSEGGPSQVKDAPKLVWELCHLRRDDVALAAEACQVNAKEFLVSVARRRVESLAARPITLRSLLDEFKADPTAESTYHELFRHAISSLCKEVNEERARFIDTSQPPEHVYRTACRLAAALAFARKTVIIKSETTSQDTSTELYLPEIEGDDVAGGQPFKVSSGVLDFTLDTALFNTRGPNFGFEQKTYLEFLAADYVAKCSLSQLRSLFCISIYNRDVVAPHLAEIAALVAVQNEEWCRHLCDYDPEVLFRTDLSPLSNDLKKRVVALYLKRVASEEAFDSLGLDRFYPSLRHPGLAAQLRPTIIDPTQNIIVRRVAIAMAGDCQLHELENELWERARQNDPCVRWIGPALSKLTGVHALSILMEVLDRKFPPSTFRTLSGVALDALVPANMPVRDALQYLDTSPKKEAIDAHHLACNYHFPEHLTDDDLAPGLHWLEGFDRVFDSLHALNRLAESIFERALGRLERDDVAAATTSLWLKCTKSHHPLPRGAEHYGRDDAEPRGLRVPELRRGLLSAIVQQGLLPPQEEPLMLLQGLLDPSDLGWALKQLDDAAPALRKAWARIVGRVITPSEARKEADTVQRIWEKIPEFRDELPPPEDGFDMVTAYERDVERHRSRVRVLSEERRRPSPSLPKRQDVLKEGLRNPLPKHTEWIEFTQWAWTRDEGEDNDLKIDRADFKTSPGWKHSTDVERIGLVDSARQFLLLNKEGFRKFGRPTNYSEAAYLAIRLLGQKVFSDPSLSDVVIRNWLISVLDSRHENGEDHARLVAFCHSRRPRIGTAALLAGLKAHGLGGVVPAALSQFYLAWNERLARATIRWALKGSLSPLNAFRLLQWIISQDSTSARTLLEQAGVGRDPFNAKPHRYIFALSAIFYWPEHYWSILFPLLKNSPPKEVRDAVLSISFDMEHGDQSILAKLNPHQIGQFSELMYQLFPLSGDSVHPNGEVHEIVPKDHVATIRQRMTDVLATLGTREACDILSGLANNDLIEDRIWIKWRLRDAIRTTADSLIPIRNSAEVFGLVAQKEAALIDTEDDLVSVILASFERLQAKMRIHSTEWRALWNEDGHLEVVERQHPSGRTPKIETTLSDVVTQWLNDDLVGKRKLVFNREVEISKGNEVDVLVQVLAKKNEETLTVPIECKRCIHAEVKTALKTQLLDRYMVPHGLTRGIYFIGWYRGDWTPKSCVWKPISLQLAREELDALAQQVCNNGVRVTSFILDCS